MLKGYLKCSDMGKMLLEYINFELSKKDMPRVAIHLRNCPVCMEKYSCMRKRKKELQKKLGEIENTLRMQQEISNYMDNEASEDVIFIVEGMLLCDENYRRELIQGEKVRRLILESRKRLTEKIEPVLTEKVLKRCKKYTFSRIFGQLPAIFTRRTQH